jgi:hypothetical protein
MNPLDEMPEFPPDVLASGMSRSATDAALLAQVRDIVQRAEERARTYPGLTGSTYYAAYLEILALVPPPP